MTTPIIFDAEIKHGVITDHNPAQPGYRYAKGWHDFAGMGIACIGAFDTLDTRTRVFMDDNFSAFAELIRAGRFVVSFNGHQFDDKLLAANGIQIPRAQSLDLAAMIWRAAGIPQGEHPRGLGLQAICEANNIPGKTGNGADAPQDYQDGRIGRVIDYCLGDVRSTTHLWRYLQMAGGVRDPRNGEWLNVAVPR